ncbi:MAG: hypothetical protein KA175_08920 [Flavobacteriales bacterium]|nr:hypothetical protein [Flavobacteriales bacterium]MBP6697726.1 hypothetical protein [Flavobacteriales bacterium]
MMEAIPFYLRSASTLHRKVIKHSTMKKAILPALFLCHTIAYAQVLPLPRASSAGIPSEAVRSGLFKSPAYFIPTVTSVMDTTLFPVLTNTATEPRTEITLEVFARFQRENQLVYDQTQTPAPLNPLPVPFSLVSGAMTNPEDPSAPLDNTVAHGPQGWVISVSNGVIDMYQNGRMRFRKDLYSFLDRKLLGPCDPKIVIDPTNQRYVVFAQRCSNQYANSEILLGFSSTSNPLDGWTFYKISGNPNRVQGQWFDYPKMALSSDGLYIGGNIFDANNRFVESVVYQVDKHAGFAGVELDYRVWSNLPQSPFTVAPVSSVTDVVYGPGIYLLSTYWAHGSERLHLYEITDDVHSPNAVLRYYPVPTDKYYFFDKAYQQNRVIDNGDPRMQDAFLYDGRIYHTFTSGDGQRNFSRVNLNVLEFPNLKNTSVLIGDDRNTSYAYPSIQLVKPNGQAPFIFVQYNTTSNTSFPSIRCKACDLSLNCSDERTIKDGDGVILGYDRWGDYSTVSRCASAGEFAYAVSSYGKRDGTRQTWMSLIAPIGAPAPAVPIEESVFTTLSFKLPGDANTVITMKRPDGATDLLFSGVGEKGTNELRVVLPEGYDAASLQFDVMDLDRDKLIEPIRSTD